MAGKTVPFLALLADRFALPIGNAKYIWRTLGDNGMVEKSTPGRGGSPVSFRDAAVAITAFVAYRAAGSLVEAMQGYMQMTVHSSARRLALSVEGQMSGDWIEDDAGRWHFDGFHQPQLTGLPAYHSFIDAFAALLEASAFNDSWPTLVDPTVRISATYAIASIEVQMHDMTEGQPAAFNYLEEGGYSFEGRVRPSDVESGIEFEATIPARIIREIASLLKGRG